jgi:hypothetical protein
MRADVDIIRGAKICREQVLIAGIVDGKSVQTDNATHYCACNACAVSEEEISFAVDTSHGPSVDHNWYRVRRGCVFPAGVISFRSGPPRQSTLTSTRCR